MTLLVLISWGVALFLAWLFVRLAAEYSHSITFLRNVPLPEGELPSVSVIIAARNEERNIEEALSSVLAQNYPHLQVIVVNDRSTDGTGAILERMAVRTRHLQVVHVRELPQGWLGKNHAAWVGAREATGEWLLFTDADVVMHPMTVTRAIAHACASEVDHLAVGPEVRVHGTMLNAFVASFMIFFMIYARPWSVRNPKSSAHIGIGAFNLVRTATYRRIGGHETIAMRPDDDMKLGKLVKKNGFRQELLSGLDMVSVEWYSSVGEAIRGLEKNTFAGVDYHLAAVAAGSICAFFAFCWPFFGVFFFGSTGFACGVVVTLLALIHALNGISFGTRFRYFFLLPVATLLMIYIMWRSALLVLRNNGIDWRGTHYPLDELKKNRV